MMWRTGLVCSVWAVCRLSAAVILNPGCPAGVNCGSGTGTVGTTATTSASNSTTTQTNNVIQRVDLFSTELRVQMQGGPLLLDQVFPMAFSSAGVQAAVLNDQTLLAMQGAAGLLGPTLVSGGTALTGSTTTSSTSTTSSTIFATLTTVGPALLQVGDIGACAGFDTASQMPFGCSPSTGQQFLVVRGSVDVDVDTHTFFTNTVTNTTTNTFTTTQVYSLIGLPTPSVPEPGTWALGGCGLLLLWWRRS